MVNGGSALLDLFLSLFLLIGISFALSYFWTGILAGRKFRIVLFPGIAVHELSHALACLLTGARIKKVKLFSAEKAHVAHEKPRLPLIGNFIISFSPIIGGIAAIALISWGFGYDFPPAALSYHFLPDSLFTLIGNLFRFFADYYQNWQFWIFSYVSLSVIIFLVPSKQDLKNSFQSTLLGFVLLFLLLHFGVFNEPISSFLSGLAGILGVGIFFGSLALAVTIPAYIVKKLIL